ncbi:metal-dependent hydrolase [Aneurinibacillus tyrosinisolvens]|uniref:metal-dependent hydrolase n=1 Tax=Aneurinibacillus tyrosinisolvens TaxID=1443435 RepID=UPI00063F27A5|nr:metal-dependent hydrolase [Aneurinibacillus tyrosinisolvens]
MDSGSHLAFGLSLAGLAYVDPAISHNSALSQAVLLGTIIGSHAPDFDMVTRIKGYASYLRHHRGITHSIPALFIWPLVLALSLAAVFQVTTYWMHLYMWSFIAVILHVFLDTLNSYGVQSMRPFTKKWIQLDILTIFDPFLFVLHTAGIVAWLGFAYEPAVIFPYIYGLTFLYIGLRAAQHRFLIRKALASMGAAETCRVIPTFFWFHWGVIVETKNCFYTGKIVYGRLLVEQVYSRSTSAIQQNPIVRATLKTEGVRAFLEFAQCIHVTWVERQHGYEVQWSDVRFWYNRKLPFGVDIMLDRDCNVVKQTLGWRKKLWDRPFV